MPKVLIIMHGFQASGKSTIARLIGKELNAKVIATHQIRAEMAAGEGMYSEKVTSKVYDTALELAEKHLYADENVIIDAMFAKKSQRYIAYALAERIQASILVIHCICLDITVIKWRVKNRQKSSLPEDEGDKMEYYYRTKMLTEALDEDTAPSGVKPIVLTVNTCNHSVVTSQIQDNFARRLVDTITSALLKYFENS